MDVISTKSNLKRIEKEFEEDYSSRYVTASNGKKILKPRIEEYERLLRELAFENEQAELKSGLDEMKEYFTGALSGNYLRNKQNNLYGYAEVSSVPILNETEEKLNIGDAPNLGESKAQLGHDEPLKIAPWPTYIDGNQVFITPEYDENELPKLKGEKKEEKLISPSVFKVLARNRYYDWKNETFRNFITLKGLIYTENMTNRSADYQNLCVMIGNLRLKHKTKTNQEINNAFATIDNKILSSAELTAEEKHLLYKKLAKVARKINRSHGERVR